MFTPKKSLLTQELTDIHQLNGSNYYDPEAKTLFQTQLENAKNLIKNQDDAKEILFTHVYANGFVNHGGHPGSRVIPFCGPTFEISFFHSTLPCRFNVCEVTDIVTPDDEKLTLSLSKKKIYNSLSLVLSIKNITDLQPLLEKLEKNYEIEKLPPIIIVLNYPHAQNAVSAIVKKSKLGILTIIKSDLNDGVNPIGMYYQGIDKPCDKLSETWHNLTAALHLFYTKVVAQSTITLKLT